MLIDGIAVIEVAQHQGIDGFELRYGHRQQAKRMHGSQRLGGVRLNEQLSKIGPQARVLRHGVMQSTPGVVQPALRFHRQLHAVTGHEDKKAQHNFRVPGARGLLDVRPPVHDRELIIRDARTPTSEGAHQSRARGGRLIQQLGYVAVNRFGMAEIQPHPFGR